MLTPRTPLNEAAKCALVSMDSTLKSNLSVGLPLDLVVYDTDALQCDSIACIDEHNAYFRMVRSTWGDKLRQAFDSIDDPRWDHGNAADSIQPTHSHAKPIKKITDSQTML
ncbi:hypothetical protein D3C81_2061780 [compost metagenome]